MREDNTSVEDAGNPSAYYVTRPGEIDLRSSSSHMKGDEHFLSRAVMRGFSYRIGLLKLTFFFCWCSIPADRTQKEGAVATQKSTRRRRKKVFRTTALQRYSLDFIRVTLAEKGFHIFPVAPWFRRHSRDFLAIPRQDYHMILVRPNRKGGIELRTYTAKFHYTRLRNELSKYKNELAKMRWGVWLQSGDNQNGWKKYISKRYASAVKLFVEEDVDR